MKLYRLLNKSFIKYCKIPLNWQRVVLAGLICISFGSTAKRASAQENPPPGPVYVVQSGDSLWEISLRFGITLNALLQANAIQDANQLTAGARLLIPGLEGLQGELTTRQIPYGENLASLSQRYGIASQVLTRLNHLSSPTQLYAGANLIVLEGSQGITQTRRIALEPGQSPLELAVLQNADVWDLAVENSLTGTWNTLPGEILHLPASSQEGASNQAAAMPAAITAVEIQPLPVMQGKATVIKLRGEAGLNLGGSLLGRPLHFFRDMDGAYIALQGIHVLADPGLYPLVISGTLPGGIPFEYSQPVFVKGGGYPFDPVLTVSPETVDPAVTRPEDAQWSALALPASAERLWNGQFKSPVPEIYSDCYPSLFGNRRSYNGSAYTYFHSGLDLCGGTGTEIYAVACGTVVFAGPLTVRGNATMIDHGWGVYTGYMHQSEILVRAGDRVEAGQKIGLIGGTGRVSGPHLHWEIWAGGIQVDPLDWLKQVYP